MQSKIRLNTYFIKLFFYVFGVAYKWNDGYLGVVVVRSFISLEEQNEDYLTLM